MCPLAVNLSNFAVQTEYIERSNHTVDTVSLDTVEHRPLQVNLKFPLHRCYFGVRCFASRIGQTVYMRFFAKLVVVICNPI